MAIKVYASGDIGLGKIVQLVALDKKEIQGLLLEKKVLSYQEMISTCMRIKESLYRRLCSIRVHNAARH